MKNNNNNITISTNFVTNFKPQLLSDFKNYEILKNNKKNQIFTKNFLIYLLLLKYKKNVFKKNSIHVKKFKKKVYTILRSPYRHKLARHQIALNRYFINFSNIIKIKKPLISNFKNIVNIINFLKNFNKLFESNLIFTTNISFSMPINFNNNFIIKNFKK